MVTSGQKNGVRYSAETWERARELYHGGMSLEGVSKELGVGYTAVRYHAWREDWGVRAPGKRDPLDEALKAQKLARKQAREETLMLMEASLSKGEELEVLAKKCLRLDSGRAKVLVSRVVLQLLSRLEDEEKVPARSAAQSLGALAPILRLLYRWGDEVDITGMELARTKSIVNLELISTTPEQLARMAIARGAHLASECNGREVGPSGVAAQQPPAAPHGPPSPEKEAPKPPTEGHSVQGASAGAPSCPAAQELEGRREAFERARAEHRRANREK